MNDQTPDAAKDVGNIVHRVLAGWPVYAVVAAALVAYGELWIDRKIDDAITAGVGGTSTVTMLQTSVALNTDAVEDLEGAVTRLDTSIVSLNDDVKATLTILATQ